MMENGVFRDVAQRLQGNPYFQNGMRLHGKGVHIILYTPKRTFSSAPISRNTEMIRNFLCWSRIWNFVTLVRLTSKFLTETHLCCRVKFGFRNAAADKTRSHLIIVTEN